nr:hypothetical protein CFP56_35378 [Quercus suber]
MNRIGTKQPNPTTVKIGFPLLGPGTHMKKKLNLSELKNQKQKKSKTHFPKNDNRACKFFKWLDTSICCMRGATIAPIVIVKFKRLEHAVEVANEELKQTHALRDATLERERFVKRMAEKAKVAHMISEKKAKKLTVTLIVSWVMFVVLLILSSRFREVKIRQMCLP